MKGWETEGANGETEGEEREGPAGWGGEAEFLSIEKDE